MEDTWNDHLEIEGDLRAEMEADAALEARNEREPSFADLNAEERAEYEGWLAENEPQSEDCTGCGEPVTDGGSHCLPPGWENAPLSAQIAFMLAGDNPEEFDSLKAYLKGE